MKAIFNIAKNVRNSRSISALSALRKLQSIGLLLCALMIGNLQVWGATASITFSSLGLENSVQYLDPFDIGTSTGVTITFAGGANDGKYYNTGSGMRTYAGGTVTVDAGSGTLTNIVFTFSANGYAAPNGVSDVGTYTLSTATGTWTGSASSVTLTRASGSGHWRLQSVSVTYTPAASGYTVTIDRNNSSYGTVSTASVTNVTSGTSISATNNVLSVGATNVTATPNSGYKFTGWTGIPGGGTVTGNITVTANFAAVTYSNYRTLCTPASDPSITVSPASITNLDYIVGQGPSAAQDITLGGSNLTASITITAPTNFEVSTDGGSTYGDSRTVTQTGGVPDVSTVKVRLKQNLAVNTYGGASTYVTFESTGATTQNVAVTGHVLKPTITATPNPVSWSTAVGVAPSTTSVTVTGVNMKANISAALTGGDATSFSISPASITQTSGSASGSITITYTGAYNAVTTKSTTLRLTSTDATTVDVTVSFSVVTDPNLYFLTALSDIHPKDKVIIVSSKDVGGASEVDYALKNATTSTTYPPEAIDVEDMIAAGRATLSYSGTDLQWNINYNSVSGEFTINRDGDDDVFLYCRDDNKALSVATSGSYNVYVINNGYIKCKDLTRFLGVYSNSDWRAYGAYDAANIANQTFTYYVKPSTDPYVTLGANFSEFTYEYTHGPSTPQSFTVSGANLSENLVVTAPSNYQVCKTVDGTYTSSVSFTPSTGTVSEQTVYIRLAAGLSVGDYDYAQASGLSVTSGTADAAKAALEGSVTPQSYTVTATSNNGSYGTASPASQSTTTTATITATPESGYRVSTSTPYTISPANSATVSQSGNTFTVTPSANTTITINFEAIPTHKVTYWASGVKVQESDVLEGASIPDQTTKTWVQLADYCATRTECVGWCTNPDYTHATDAPTGMITTQSPGGTMSTSDVNYYAVFANTGGSSNTFSRVTSLSQLVDGDVIAIVAEQSGGQIFGTGADHKGGSAPAETDGKITVSAATNKWTLEAGTGDNTGKWYILKDASNKLCYDLTYTAYGNAATITNSLTDSYYIIKFTKALEYYSNAWTTYSISDPVTAAQNGNVRLKLYKNDPGHIQYVTNCACPAYSMHFGTRGSDPSDWSDKDSYCFVESEDADGNSGVYWYLEDFELPAKPHFYVGWEGLWNTTDAKSADADFSDLCFGLVRDNQFSCGYKTLGTYSTGNNQGAVGTLRVRSSYTDNNKYIDFIPDGYVLRLSDNNGSTYASTALLPASATLTETVWTTDGITTISATLASSGKFFVDLKTATGQAEDHVWAPNMSQETNISSMGYKKDGGNSAGSWGTGLSAGMRGKFRILANNCNKNWNCHFVPYYHLSYDGNGGGDAVTNVPEASADKSCEGDNTARTVQVSTTVPVRAGYTFTGWKDGGGTPYAANAPVVLSSDMVLYAQWTQNYTVQYNRAGGTNVCADETCGAGLTYTVCTTSPTKSGYIFGGWSDGVNTYTAGQTFTMPSANVTLTAQWTANWHNLTFTIHDSEDGTITGGPSGNHVLDDHTFTFPNITGKSEDKWCWTFLGWTETAPVAAGVNAGKWTSVPEYTAYSVTSPKIYTDKTYYAVYTKAGAGASGDVALSNSTIVAKWTGAGNAYGTLTTLTEDAKTWNYTGFGQSGNSFLQLKDGESYYLQTPTVGGAITSITVNYTAVSTDSRTVYFNTSASKTSAVTHTFDGTYTSGNHDLVVDVSSLNATSIYILANNTFKINSVSFHFGPPAIYANTLDECPCQVTQFDLTYDANTANFPGSTISCTDADDYKFAENDDEYTFCEAPSLSGYKFKFWAVNPNGSGEHWDAGETVNCLPSDNITVYAFYEQVHTVTFDNQGTLTPVTQDSYGAAIAVPAATTPCDGEWAFVGWSETAIAPMSMQPSIEIASGTSTYTPTADKTLYAIYRKTSTSSAFVAGMSGAYKITNGSTVYAGACNNNKLPETNAAGAAVFYIKYTSADGGKYTIQQSDGKYLKYAGSSTSLALDDETPYYWTMTKNGDLWHVLGVGSGRYLQYSSGTGFKAYNGSGYTDIAFVAADGQYYYRTMSCDTDYDITFHANGTTINWADGHPEAEYKDLADATVVSTFPTATFEGWTFLGWRRSDYAESTTAPVSSGIFGGSDGTSGNALTISSANEDLYPVFTKFEDNEPFDQINGGDYYIYFLQEGSDDGYGGAKRVYAATYADNKRYNSSALCEEATEFTFTKLANGNWTIYDKKKGKYLYGIEDDDLKHKTGTTGAEWTLTVNGNQFDAFHVGTTYGQLIANGDGTSATFMNYRRTNISSNPGLYHRVYLGGCSNRVFTTNPSNTPEIEIHGQVKVTSTATKSVKARSVLTVTASNISTANLTVTSDNSAFKFSLTQNGSYTASVDIPVVSNKVGVTPIYIEYTPAAGSTSDGIEGAIVTVSDGAGTPTSVSTLSGDVQGRHLPANFVIAAKWDDKWYALPANCTTSTSSTTGILIEVDNASDPTTATLAPDYTKYGLREVASGRYAANGSNITFVEKLTTSPAREYTLYNGNTTSIQVNAQWSGYSSTNPEKYEWVPSTDDFKDYTLTSATGDGRTVSLNNNGVFGTLSQDKSYDGMVRLLPATFYEESPVQVLEWKANSVVVMYTGTETSATTRVGANSASSAQTLADQKLTYGIYELTTSQALTSNDGKVLLLSFGDTKKTFDVPIIINSDVTASDGHSKQDVVIVNGGKLTSVGTKYSYRNVYVYGGGKLKIASGTQLGVNNIILRAGGITTSGIGSSPSATYEYVYPQVELGGELSSTKTDIKYEYITDYDHWYHLCLPFDANYTSITYPTEYYGSNVTEGNSGSWIIKRYDGATRATGEYNAWVDIESDWKKEGDPKTIYAGHGYIFWGAPKKVTIGEDKQRQKWGIQRMTMSITAGAATTAETANKTVDGLSSYSDVEGKSSKNNDQGWNLIGNPYMVNLTGLNSTSLQVGQLVHTDTDPWDGKWKWDETDPDAGGLRYVTIPDNHFDNYEAKTMSWFSADHPMEAGRAFFVQIAGANTSVVFASGNRASLMPAWERRAEAEQIVDIETGIVLSDDDEMRDEVNFWIKSDKTEAYEYNADYPKTPNNTNFNIYGVHEVGQLSWVAISPEIAEGSMAIGYQVPAAGDYTLSLSETYLSDKIEALYVTDHEINPEFTTNLMEDTYSFGVKQAESNDTRFTARIVLKDEAQVPTDVGNIDGMESEHPLKFLYRDKLYILRNGVLYDATGKKVSEINK